MMKVSVLSSGSKGNCTYVETKNHKFLIDIGTNCLYVEKALSKIGVNAEDIDYIFITHSHVDHIAGLRVFSKKYKPNIYLTEKIYNETKLNLENVNLFESDFNIDDLKIGVINTSHDVSSVGYIFEYDNKSLVYITDTGYIKEKYFNKLANKNIYIFESNHDVEMLMNNKKYPHNIKIRILSDKGHLSNKDSAYCLSNFIGSNTEYVVLAHLSEENNSKELAISTLKNELNKKNIQFKNILVAEQNNQTELLSI